MCQNHRLKRCPKWVSQKIPGSAIFCVWRNLSILLFCLVALWLLRVSCGQQTLVGALPAHLTLFSLFWALGQKLKASFLPTSASPEPSHQYKKIASCRYFFTYLSHTYSWIFIIIFSQSKCVLFALYSYSTKRSFKELFPGHGTSGMWNNISRKTWRFQLFLTKHPMNTNRCIVGIFYCPSKFPYVCLI